MTLASDQNRRTRDLSPTSKRMLELRTAVFEEWEKRVRASITETTGLSRPLLIDSLPSFYDNIAQTITDDYARLTATERTTLASEHGSERARLTNFDPQALVSEYQIFRWTLFDVLHQHGVLLTHPETLAINASIDCGIREAVTAFSLVQAAFREQFIAALTHDLRGPLHTAKMAQELILMGTEPAKMKSFAAKTIDHLNRIDHMIASLLDSMAAKSGERMKLELTQFDIGDVIKEVQVDAAATHPHAQFKAFGGSIRGYWDRSLIKRAIENLLSNAVKYGDSSQLIRITFDESYERLVLMVHNEGQPIPPEEQEDIFQMFGRAQAAKEGKISGWGVGLPFVRNVVESHGGTIGLDSTAERGTTFTIDIPLDTRPFQGAPTTL